MSITIGYSTFGGMSCSTIEKSLAVDGGSTNLSTSTASGIYTLMFWSSALVKGDEAIWRVYEKVSSTATRQRVFSGTLSDVQSEATVIPNLMLGLGWDMTLAMNTTTARVFDGSIRRVST